MLLAWAEAYGERAEPKLNGDCSALGTYRMYAWQSAQSPARAPAKTTDASAQHGLWSAKAREFMAAYCGACARTCRCSLFERTADPNNLCAIGVPPLRQLDKHRENRLTEFGEFILDPSEDLGIVMARHDTVALEFTQLPRQHSLRNTRDMSAQLVKAQGPPRKDMNNARLPLNSKRHPTLAAQGKPHAVLDLTNPSILFVPS